MRIGLFVCKKCKKAEGKLLTCTKFITLKRECISFLKVLTKQTVMSTTLHLVFQWYSIISGFLFSGHVLALLYRNMKHFLVYCRCCRSSGNFSGLDFFIILTSVVGSVMR